MRTLSIAAAALLLMIAVLPSQAAAGTYKGDLLFGTAAPVTIGCGNNIPCEPTDAAGYDGISLHTVELDAAEVGQPFTLSGSSPTGFADMRICFYDGQGDLIECIDQQLEAPETGTVPADTTHADIQLFAGVDVHYTLEI